MYAYAPFPSVNYLQFKKKRRQKQQQSPNLSTHRYQAIFYFFQKLCHHYSIAWIYEHWKPMTFCHYTMNGLMYRHPKPITKSSVKPIEMLCGSRSGRWGVVSKKNNYKFEKIELFFRFKYKPFFIESKIFLIKIFQLR